MLVSHYFITSFHYFPTFFINSPRYLFEVIQENTFWSYGSRIRLKSSFLFIGTYTVYILVHQTFNMLICITTVIHILLCRVKGPTVERGTAVPRTSWIIELPSKLSRQYYCTALVQWKFIHLWHEGNSSLFEIQLSRHSSRWLSISDQFRPLPRGLVSRLSLRMFPGVQRY